MPGRPASQSSLPTILLMSACTIIRQPGTKTNLTTITPARPPETTQTAAGYRKSHRIYKNIGKCDREDYIKSQEKMKRPDDIAPRAPE
jgi:hypothetical protein